MSKNTITIRQSVLINKPKEVVFDFTQNYDNRAKWDSSVLQATILQTSPNRIVKLKMKGNTEMTFVYKLDNRPDKTSLATQNVQSLIIKTAGGSWSYEEQDNQTIWTQVNTIVFKDSFLLQLIKPFMRWMFKMQTNKAMNKAKKLIELL
jgi:hypothetical protein